VGERRGEERSGPPGCFGPKEKVGRRGREKEKRGRRTSWAGLRGEGEMFGVFFSKPFLLLKPFQK
jgi:hypothetical protein